MLFIYFWILSSMKPVKLILTFYEMKVKKLIFSPKNSLKRNKFFCRRFVGKKSRKIPSWHKLNETFLIFYQQSSLDCSLVKLNNTKLWIFKQYTLVFCSLSYRRSFSLSSIPKLILRSNTIKQSCRIECFFALFIKAMSTVSRCKEEIGRTFFIY